jgi:hypothetical protein
VDDNTSMFSNNLKNTITIIKSKYLDRDRLIGEWMESMEEGVRDKKEA